MSKCVVATFRECSIFVIFHPFKFWVRLYQIRRTPGRDLRDFGDIMRIENDSRVFLSRMLEEFTPNIKLRSKMNDIFELIQIDKDHGQIIISR